MKTNSTIPSLVLAVCLALHASPARAQSSAELLEKGIYTQETKGDLEGAIAIYEKLVGDAKATQALAAQAQFRLGQCLQKKGRQNDATAAFEKLIREFPNEKELIGKAREFLPADIAVGPVPWVDGERLHMVLTLPGGMDIGAMELRANLVENEGRKAWRVGRRMGGGGHMISSVDVDPETFRPFASYWKHTMLGTVSATFKPGEVTMQKEGVADPIMARPEKTVFDNEEVMHLMRRLPLQVGYKATIPVITTLGGGVVLSIGIEVPGKETVETPAGKFDCFKIVMNVGQNFWISDDEHRYLVKFDGAGAIAHLTSIEQRKAGAVVPFSHDALGVAFTAPPEWVVHVPKKSGSEKTDIHLLDPAAKADHLAFHLHPTSSIPAAARQSARAWAEQDLREEATKHFKDVKVQTNSWKNYTVAGRPGIGYVAEYTQQDKPKVLFAIYAMGPKTSEQLVLTCAPEALAELRASVEGILATYRVTK